MMAVALGVGYSTGISLLFLMLVAAGSSTLSGLHSCHPCIRIDAKSKVVQNPPVCSCHRMVQNNFTASLLACQEVAAPMEGGAAEETTLLTGPIQGDVVTINQRSLDLMLLQVGCSPGGAPLCCMHACHPSVTFLPIPCQA